MRRGGSADDLLGDAGTSDSTAKDSVLLESVGGTIERVAEVAVVDLGDGGGWLKVIEEVEETKEGRRVERPSTVSMATWTWRASR